ncbi:DUF1254 domain-containing protein [Shewanella sp. OMA3-2]|uniref:DUF1254 domain-containing protein n=1 Tax=Shewanella sp. OMA3-2 TaxID=2908650 RepID=UPI001F247A5A|nr:DUF1254 domain-containing protein [Shewanella sp. OMA3-2]UJF22724.1 DUF1254 domain-containing protein [Shewanella sp. OMA3-2]
MKILNSLSIHIAVASLLLVGSSSVQAEVSKKTLESISIADTVETPIGTLEFFDGVPSDATINKVYDNLDRSRAMGVYLDNMGAVSINAVLDGLADAGANTSNKVALFEQLMDSKTLVITANTSTLYAYAGTDLANDGPTVIEVPAGMLGFLDDSWQRFVGDIGVTGPDKGKGGKYLVLPPGYKGPVPDGYFLLKPKTNRNFLFLRGSIKNGLAKAANNIKSGLKIYPLKNATKPAKTEFVNVSGKEFNTLFPNDLGYFEILNDIIQREPVDAIGPEVRGAIASIGIVKGQAFKPDARMNKLLLEAGTLGNATSRAITVQPRIDGVAIYPDSNSGWTMAYANKNTSFEANGTMNLDARTLFYFNAGGVTPAMAVTKSGAGSDYALAFLDAQKQAFDGAKTYKLHLPANVPVNNFWAVTMYDTQTRSQLQTSQPFPTVGSLTDGIKMNSDGSYELFFGPKAPKGQEGNWLATVPGKSWFLILRMYGPLDPWINKTWRPSEIELVK